jgi:dTDP-4-dehydrorhamnose reductase
MVGTSSKQNKITMWLILGANGQLGKSLQTVLTSNDISFTAVDRQTLDITNRDDCMKLFTSLAPAVVVNCAAWTAVDLAEDNEAEAFRINCDATRNIAIASREVNAINVHISTDYVFPGVADTPYEVNSPTAPVSIYGKSKLCGEIAITEEYPDKSYIVRTAWLYSPHGGNFVKTMIRKARTSSPVRVVSDQLGQPTLAADLAQHIVDLVTHQAPYGIFHGTNSGAASWYELTCEIYSLLGVDTSLVSSVATSEYPTKAVRPQYSVLSHARTIECGVAEMQNWQTALKESLPNIAKVISEEIPQ